MIVSINAHANPSLNANASNSLIEQTLQGKRVTITGNSLSVKAGENEQYGTFSNGNRLSGTGPVIGIEDGVFMSTSDATDGNTVIGPNDDDNISDKVNTRYSDNELENIDSKANYDPVVLELKVTPQASKLKFNFVFGSDEYPKYVCSRFNDVFGFFIKPTGSSSWQNVALVPNKTPPEPIAVNMINGGSCGSSADGTHADLTNTALFVDNGLGDTPSSNSNLQYNGFTVPLSVGTTVTPNQTYDVKLAIADTGDARYDSAVFLKNISSSDYLNNADVELSLTANTLTPKSQKDTVTFTLTARNTHSDPVGGVTVDFDLPSGFTWVSDTSSGRYNASSGLWSLPNTLNANSTQSIQIVARPTGSGGSINAFAQVTAMQADDVDSIPNNGVQATAEDDEATITLNVQPPPEDITCPATTGNGGYAASGLGKFKNEIFWLTWDCAGRQFIEDNTYTKSWNLINNTVVTAEIRNIRNASVKTYNSGSWSGDTFDDAYSGINPVGLTNASNGQTPKFDVHWSMTIDGVSRPVDLVFSDVEDTASGERVEGTTNGAPWEIFEVVPNPNASDVAFNALFSNSGKTLELQGIRNYYSGAVVGFTKGVSVLSMDIKNAGIQGVGFGIVLPFDRGDAPASYGDPTHYIPKIASGTSQSSGTFTAAQLNAAVPNISNEYDYYLGSVEPDAERIASPSANANTDSADEDGVLLAGSSLQNQSLAKLETKLITINTHGSGYLNAWIDWNGDGDFNDSGEQIAQNVAPTSNKIYLTITPPNSATTGTTFARFRFGSQQNLTPTNHTVDGEVEDYKITLTAPAPITPVISQCPEAIPNDSPTAALTAAQVSWDISGTGSTSSAILNSFSVTGQPRPFTEIIMPNRVAYQFKYPNASKQFIQRHAADTGVNILSSTFNSALLAANSDRDITHYLSLDGTIYKNDYVDFYYDTPIKSAGNRYILISERNGNNAMGVEALDGNNNVIGSMAAITPNVTNIDSGILLRHGQNAHFTIYPLTAIAPAGTDIHGIRLTQTGSPTNGGDGGDGKVFIMVDPVTHTNPPQLLAPTVTAPTCANPTASITVNANSNGSNALEYSVDGTNYQDSNIFNNLAAGGYNIKARYKSHPNCAATYISNPVTFTAPTNCVPKQPALPTGHCAINHYGWNVTFAGATKDIQHAGTAFTDAGWNFNSNNLPIRYESPAVDGTLTATQSFSELTTASLTTAGETHLSVTRVESTPNSNVSININDPNKQEHYIFAALDASGNVLTRLPANGEYFSNDGVVSGNKVPASKVHQLNYQAPSDGIAYIYIWVVDVDEGMASPYPHVICQDYGDAPSQYAQAGHGITGDLFLGSQKPDADKDTQASSAADADGNEDDGVSNPLFIAGKSTNIPVTVSGSGGYLQAWVDWNQDGDFADLGEQVATDLQDTDNDGFINVYATAPAGASTGDSYARFRWSSQSGLDTTTAASDGEVEDYKIKVASAPAGFSGSCSADGNIWYNSPTKLYTYNIFSKQETVKTNLSKVYGDIALGRNGKLYGVTFGFGGAKALDEIDPDTGTTTTLFTDLPLSGNNALSVDEFGWLYIGMSTGTKVYRYLPGVSTELELWIDVSKYGESGNSSGDFIMIDGAAYIAWSKIVTVTTSNSVSTSFSSQLLRVSSLGSNNEVTPSSTVTSLGNMPTSFYGLTGNVAGKLYGVSSTKGLYEVARSPFGTTKIADLSDIPYGATSLTEAYGTVCNSYDYSDAPSSYGSPYHSISNDLHLGKTAPLPENATQPSTTADADGAEEDGARFATSLIKGAKAVLHIDVTKPSGASPKIDAWVDWNKDGSFSSSEKVIDNDALTGTAVDKAYTLDVPSDAVAGDTYLRVRLSTAGGLSPDGAANDGEVEDFLVTVINGGTISGQVWLDNNEDGANNAGDTGIQNATVKLYQKSSNRFLQAVQADASGNYSFTQLPADTYYLEFVALPSHTLVAKGADSKADASTARTDDITLAAGNTQANWNAGYTTSASVVSHCSVAPAYNSAAFTHNFSLPKFDSTSGILLGVRIDTYPVMRQVWGVENTDAAVASYQISYSSSSPAQFTLPNGNQVDHNYNHDLGTLAPAAFDNVIDFAGTSGQGSTTWSYETATQQTTYTPITGFQSASAGEQITIPYTAWNHQATTQFNGGTPSYVNAAESSANICVIYTYASKDYGDAPDSYGVASHSVANGQLFLGTHAPDTESKSLNTSNGGADGTGDDSNGTDDEDGSSFVPLSTSDSAYTTTVTATNTTGKDATLVGWVDFNNNDSFEAIEAVSTTIADGTTNGTVTLKWDFLNESGGASTAAGATFARLRLSTDAALDTSFHAGDLSDGEVEDYALTITAPPEKAAMACSGAWAQEGSNYTTTLSNGIKITASTTIATGGSWKYSPNGNLNTHDAFSDADLKGNTSFQFVYNWDATREGSGNAADDGVNGTMTFSFDRPVFNPILHIDRVGGVGNGVSNSALITLTTPNTSMSKLSGFSHLTVTSNAIQRTIGVPSNGAESNSDPAQGTAAGSIAIQGEKLNSLDFTLSPLGVEGAGGDGIEMVLCIDNNYDYGDAPTSYGRPHHYYPAADSPYLGAQKADVETDTLNGSNGGTDGLGDDQGNLDDEDGISTLTPLNASASRYSTQVIVNNPLNEQAYLLAWIDFDGNGTFDNDELKTVTIAAHENNANVTVVWDKLPNDIQAGNSYLRLRLTSDNDVFNAKSATAVAANGEVEDYTLTIENTTFSVAGRLFTDSDVDGIYDSGERGMQKILVALTGTDTQGNAVCIGTLSKADGRYQFVNIPTGNYTVYETTDTSGTCNVANANAPTSFIATTPMSQAITVSNANIADVNFGQIYNLVVGNDGSNIAFHKDEQSQIVAGEVVTYAHTFQAPAKGTVNFVQNLQGNNWGSLLHHDANCDRKLSSAERNTTLSTINVNANDQVCLVATVGSPISAQTGEQSKLQITANFTYAGTLSAQTRSLSVTDITTVKQGTEEQGAPLSNFDHRRLELIKTVQNITAGTPATETLNQAQPDDILEYRIHYYNQTAKDIDHLNVNDMVPDYTSLVGGSAGCDNTPTGLSCSAQINGDAIQWNFSGVLKSGHRGSVRYRVTVD